MSLSADLCTEIKELGLTIWKDIFLDISDTTTEILQNHFEKYKCFTAEQIKGLIRKYDTWSKEKGHRSKNNENPKSSKVEAVVETGDGGVSAAPVASGKGGKDSDSDSPPSKIENRPSSSKEKSGDSSSSEHKSVIQAATEEELETSLQKIECTCAQLPVQEEKKDLAVEDPYEDEPVTIFKGENQDYLTFDVTELLEEDCKILKAHLQDLWGFYKPNELYNALDCPRRLRDLYVKAKRRQVKALPRILPVIDGEVKAIEKVVGDRVCKHYIGETIKSWIDNFLSTPNDNKEEQKNALIEILKEMLDKLPSSKRTVMGHAELLLKYLEMKCKAYEKKIIDIIDSQEIEEIVADASPESDVDTYSLRQALEIAVNQLFKDEDWSKEQNFIKELIDCLDFCVSNDDVNISERADELRNILGKPMEVPNFLGAPPIDGSQKKKRKLGMGSVDTLQDTPEIRDEVAGPSGLADDLSNQEKDVEMHSPPPPASPLTLEKTLHAAGFRYIDDDPSSLK